MDGGPDGETSREIAFCDYTIRSGEIFAVEDALLDERFRANPLVTGYPGIRSYVGAPLTTVDGYNLGALCAIDTKPRCYSEQQMAVLGQFSRLVVNLLELRTLAHEDHLTSLMSRRAFTHAAARLIEGGHGPEVTLVTFDIDHFKRVNDCFGHGVGDLVLAGIAECTRAVVRPGDLVGRLGGEEFGLLLPRTSLDEGEAIAERVRAAIEALAPADRPRVTASFGIALLDPQMTLEAWLATADRALYAAKAAGRNRIRVGTASLAVAA